MKPVSINTKVTTPVELLHDFVYKGNYKWYTDILQEYAKHCEFIVEFGIFQGVSTSAFLTTKPTTLTSYDIDLTLVDIPLLHRICPEKTTLVIEKRNSLIYKAPKSDLLFLDTRHTYEHVKQELEAQGDTAQKYIIVHDTLYPKKPGKKVGDAVQEFCNNTSFNIDLVISEHTGLMVLKRL